MADTPDPLSSKVKIVNPDGTPTPFFIQQWQLQFSFNGEAGSVIAVEVGGNGTEILPAMRPLADGNIQLELAPSGVVAGTKGSSTHIPVIEVDAKGRVVALTDVAASGGGGGGGASTIPLTNGEIPNAAMDDDEGQMIAVPIGGGAESKIGAYLSYGLAADIPNPPAVPAGCTAGYYATDASTFFVWNGTDWV